MNRIILIGNGFDLAHSLKTSYRNFIDAYWEKKINCFAKNYSQFTDDDIEVIGFNPCQIYNYSILKSINTFKEFENFLKANKSTIRYKNRFFEIITKKSFLRNWVDIEEEYYMQLKEIINPVINNKGKENKYGIIDLNNDFAIIKNKLTEYLTEEISNRKIHLNEHICNLILGFFQLNDLSKKGYEHFYNENYNEFLEIEKKVKNHNAVRSDPFSVKIEDWIKGINSGKLDKNRFFSVDCAKNHPKQILFLNFNYTNTETLYLYPFTVEDTIRYESSQETTRETIHIHGELNNSHNPIIFGYGDEQDETHKEIEKLGGKYLDNVKTINYLKTPNYKNLLSFIESRYYQIVIMGHSCGLSDKTLLNTLFEHPNCVSIKPFYYIDNNGHNNYDDIVKNIYRCFTNKALMREKVVNLEYCKSLN
jgi:hypothetical protein